MPNIIIGEDVCEFECGCGYHLSANMSRFKLMMRLHQKKCALRYNIDYCLHETIVRPETGRIVSKTTKPVLGP